MSQAEFVDGSVEGRAVTSDGAERPAFLIGLIGSGIQASRTPRLHEDEGVAWGLL